jgi:hypothetical protein
MRAVTVYSVLDKNNYRRLETVKQDEATYFHYALNRNEGGAQLVASQRTPTDWAASRPKKKKKR